MTMQLQGTRDWMQYLLDHHVPPLTREDVVGLGLIDGIGALDSGDEATDRLPYPTIYDTAHVVHIVAGSLLVEAGWTRPGESADEQLMAIVRAAEPWLADVEQALAHPETAHSWARAVRLGVLVRHRRVTAAASNRALVDAFATMRGLLEGDQLAIARRARRRDYSRAPTLSTCRQNSTSRSLGHSTPRTRTAGLGSMDAACSAACAATLPTRRSARGRPGSFGCVTRRPARRSLRPSRMRPPRTEPTILLMPSRTRTMGTCVCGAPP